MEATNGDDCATALHDGNRQKNRSDSLLPGELTAFSLMLVLTFLLPVWRDVLSCVFAVERSRVRLSPCAGDASDYINASYVTVRPYHIIGQIIGINVVFEVLTSWV